MRRRKPPPAGEFVADILDLAHDGRGVARVEGKATFVADALPGERVRIRYLGTGRDFDEATTVAVEQASPDRVAPACDHFGLCGGCALQHVAAERQIAFKQAHLLEALQRIGKVTPQEVAPPLTGRAFGYRRRARLGVKHVPKKGGVLVGFRERHSSYLAALQGCHTLDPRVGMKLRELGAAIAQLSIRDRVPQIEVACADHVALVMRVLDPPGAADRAVLAQLAAREGFEIYLQSGGPDSIVPMLPPARPLTYSPDGSDLSLRFEPTDFIQVNGEVSQKTVKQALDWLDPAPGERVLELFCGLGNFSLPLARRGADVTAIEGDAGLVRRARENAQANHLAIRFEQGDLFKTTADAPWLRETVARVLLDPPRDGAREVLPLVAQRGAQRVVYVSCHPATLARDAGMLVHEHGFTLRRAGVMDMFPQTAHVESMALFER